MLISELFDAICWEISVESGSTDFQLVDDITDEWIIFCVFEHRFSMLDGLFIHCPWAAAPARGPFRLSVESYAKGHLALFRPSIFACEQDMSPSERRRVRQKLWRCKHQRNLSTAV